MSDAHSEEIFEGLIDAMMRGDVESFKALNVEWERIDIPAEGKTAIRFAGPPRRATAMGTCPHCNVSWSHDGMLFDEDVDHGLIQQQMHLFSRCPRRKQCRCWVDAEDGSESWERCLACDLADVDCSCLGGAEIGPCLNVDVVIVYADQS